MAEGVEMIIKQLKGVLYPKRRSRSHSAVKRAEWQEKCLASLSRAGVVGTGLPLQRFRTRRQFLHYLRTARNSEHLFIFPPHIRWRAALIQRTHHLARALARLGCHVVYVTPSNGEQTNGYIEIEPRLFLTSDSLLLEDAAEATIHVPSTAWRFGPAEISRWRERDNCIIYDYLDHIDDRITGAKTEATRQLFDYITSTSIDVAVASAYQLRKTLSPRVAPKPVTYLPNGVDVEFFSQSLVIDIEPPPEIAPYLRTRQPLIGYFGAIAPWLCGDLVRAAAALRPDWLFLFIGPRYQNRESPLPAADNVVHIPAVDYRVLPQYGRWFDVATIPFAAGTIARTTSPLKMFEYLALGKPIVAHADLLECRSAPGVLSFQTPVEFVQACEAALSPETDETILQARRWAAATADWRLRAASLLSAITARRTDVSQPGDLSLMSRDEICQLCPELLTSANLELFRQTDVCY